MRNMKAKGTVLVAKPARGKVGGAVAAPMGVDSGADRALVGAGARPHAAPVPGGCWGEIRSSVVQARVMRRAPGASRFSAACLAVDGVEVEVLPIGETLDADILRKRWGSGAYYLMLLDGAGHSVGRTRVIRLSELGTAATAAPVSATVDPELSLRLRELDLREAAAVRREQGERELMAERRAWLEKMMDRALPPAPAPAPAVSVGISPVEVERRVREAEERTALRAELLALREQVDAQEDDPLPAGDGVLASVERLVGHVAHLLNHPTIGPLLAQAIAAAAASARRPGPLVVPSGDGGSPR